MGKRSKALKVKLPGNKPPRPKGGNPGEPLPKAKPGYSRNKQIGTR